MNCELGVDSSGSSEQTDCLSRFFSRSLVCSLFGSKGGFLIQFRFHWGACWLRASRTPTNKDRGTRIHRSHRQTSSAWMIHMSLVNEWNRMGIGKVKSTIVGATQMDGRAFQVWAKRTILMILTECDGFELDLPWTFSTHVEHLRNESSHFSSDYLYRGTCDSAHPAIL